MFEKRKMKKQRISCAKNELPSLIIKNCELESVCYSDLLQDYCEQLGRIPEEDDLPESLMLEWRKEYLDRVADSTIAELTTFIPNIRDSYMDVKRNPSILGIEDDPDAFESGMSAAVLYIFCYTMLTEEPVSYGKARPLTVRQVEIMNEALLHAFESVSEELFEEEDGGFSLTDYLRERFEEQHIELSEEEISAYADMFDVIYEFVHYKLSIDDLFSAYDFLGDVITGREPEFAIAVPKEDIIAVQVRALEYIGETAGVLSLEEKTHFAFCVYYSLMVGLEDPNTGTLVSGLFDFRDTDHIERCLEDDRLLHPERYAFENELDEDEIVENANNNQPDAEFGYSISKPIQAVSVSASYAYLDRLHKEGYRVEYKRIRALWDPETDHTMDKYLLIATPLDDIHGVPEEKEIYIDPYSLVNSQIAPLGFMLEENEGSNFEDIWITEVH